MDKSLTNARVSAYGPLRTSGGCSSPEFRALMEASWEELTSATDAFHTCNELVHSAEKLVARVSEICARNRCLSVSDLYRLIEAGPVRPRGLDEYLVKWMNGRTSLVITLGRAVGVALVAKELDEGWSVFERRVGRSVRVAEYMQSSHAERRNEQTNEVGRHFAGMLEHDWKMAIRKWADIQAGAVFVSVLSVEKVYSAGVDAFDPKCVPDSPQQCQWDFQVNMIAHHSQVLLKQLNVAADRFLNADRRLGEGHRMKMFRELLELDLRFQRSIGWEGSDS